MISPVVQTIPDVEIPEPGADAGFGVLQTARGNLPLTSLDVTMASTGLACRTELVQGFTNPYAEPLEATYIFPLPDRSAVTSLRMEADGRVVEGILHERAEARRKYDEALERGERAAIMEEERPGVFTMRVGNILPGESVKLRLTLAGQLPFEDGVATMRFPLVVAPRYIPGKPIGDAGVGSGTAMDTHDVPDASRITPPVLLPGFPNRVALSITADIDPAGLPVGDVASSLHPVAVEELGGGRLRVSVHPGERADRDFILRMRLGAEDVVTHSLVVVPDGAHASDRSVDDAALGDIGSGTFAVTVLPPRVTAATRPIDVVVVLDRSGSMGGWKIVAARRAAGRIVDTLTSNDRFAVLAFDSTVETAAGIGEALVAATDRNRFRAVEFLAGLEARGGTEMLEPLETAARMLGASRDAQRDRALVLVTDGQVGNEDQILGRLGPELVGTRIHTVGVDTAVNAGFLQRLAKTSGGRCELVESEDALDRAMDAIHRRIGAPLVTDLQLDAAGLDVIADTLTPSPLPALYAGAPLVITGRYRGEPAGAVFVRGTVLDIAGWEIGSEAAGSTMDLAPVWARSRLRDLEDAYASADRSHTRYLPHLEKQIVATSLRFGVLCRFTAFVAIDTRVVNEGGELRRVTQPVEWPAGWQHPAFGDVPLVYDAHASYYGAMYEDVDLAMAGPFADASLDASDDAPFLMRSIQRSLPRIGIARDRVAEQLRLLRAAAPADRGALLLELRDWIVELIVQFEQDLTDAELQPLRELARELAQPIPNDELADVWEHATGVLEDFVLNAPRDRRSGRHAFWRRGG